MISKRGTWKTKFGFYLAAVGSAAGLGNLWRFPYVVGENGGGAFVLLYVLLVLSLGLSMMIAELMMGQSTKKSLLVSLTKEYRWVGRLALILSIAVLSYYSVISGWALHFSTVFLVEIFSPSNNVATSMGSLVSSPWLQAGLVSVHLLFATIVVLKGIEEGLERWTAWIMPCFAFLLLLLVFKSLSLPSSTEAMRFLFYPDFSKLTWGSLIHAIGHVGFTLSIGFGTLVTFGSYLNQSEHIPTASFRITLIDTVISLVAGLLIFPIAIGASNSPLTDPRLMFEALPTFIASQPGGRIFGLAFFVCLYLAALNATIGLIENVVSNWVDRTRWSRKISTWSISTVIFLLSLGTLFSSQIFRLGKFENRSMLEIVDGIVVNWILPFIILGMSYAMARGFSDSEKRRIFIDPDRVESGSLYTYWVNMLKWAIPSVILFAFFLQIVGLIISN